MRMCKWALGVGVSTPNCVVLSELGRVSIECVLKRKTIHWWKKMMSSDIGLMTECVLVHRKVNTALYKYISTILNDIEITESDIGHHSFSLLWK